LLLKLQNKDTALQDLLQTHNNELELLRVKLQEKEDEIVAMQEGLQLLGPIYIKEQECELANAQVKTNRERGVRYNLRYTSL